MKPRSVVVIGAGIAGTAAALAARRAGADVVLIDGGAGASTLASGALDLTPWDAPHANGAAPIDTRASEVLDALDAFAVARHDVLLATTAGIVRPARGADRALLDLAALPEGVVVVPKSENLGWDASVLARAWSHARSARDRNLQFRAIDAQITRFSDERILVDADLAARHDDPARLAWLAVRLEEVVTRAAVGNIVAVILPPWLGVEASRAAALSKAIGVPCGEAIGMPAGPSGFRFEHARTRALAAAQVTTRRGRVTKIDGAFRVSLEEGAPLAADRVVVAAGGLIGGGMAYAPSASILAGALPPHARLTFACTIDGPLAIGLRGHRPTMPGSLFGETPESLAWPFTDDPALERAGILTGAEGRVPNAPEGLYAAGDGAADRPRTWLAALTDGARAGHAAASA